MHSEIPMYEKLLYTMTTSQTTAPTPPVSDDAASRQYYIYVYVVQAEGSGSGPGPGVYTLHCTESYANQSHILKLISRIRYVKISEHEECYL